MFHHIGFIVWTYGKYTPGASGSNTGKQWTVICYNCKGEGHISKQCTMPKRKRDETWFNDKVLLVQAQASGQVLTEEEIAFLADPELPDTWNGYLRKGRKTKPKRQNRTRNGKAWRRHSQIQAQV
ncbi:integrase, catalytic region, zinc finger, CCHC-type containing protein [Tanacetum coccineum]